MGLDTTHECWHGGYGAFMAWREALAKAAGIPLRLMEGFFQDDFVGGAVMADAMKWAAPREGGPLCNSHHGPVLHRWIEAARNWLPISWDVFAADPLTVLLNHSDCDGAIEAKDCGPLADRLAELLPKIPHQGMDGNIYGWRARTQTFIDGLRLAAAAGENVEFH